MGLMESLNIPGMMPAAPAVPAPASVPIFNTTAGVGAVLGGHDIASQMAAITGGMPIAAPVAPSWPAGFPEAIAEIDAKGYGFPPLSGPAAAAYTAYMRARGSTGHNADGVTAGYAGSGDLARVETVTDPARIVGIAIEMRALPPKPSAAPPVVPVAPAATMGIVSMETPPSNPALAALPVEGFAMPGATTPNVQVPGLMASVPASVAAPIMAAGATAVNPAVAGLPGAPAETPAKPKGKGGRPKKNAAAGDNANTATAGEDPSWLFVDCRPNIAHTDLQDHIDTWAVGIGKHFKCDYDDVRLAGKDSPLAYGGWEGAISGVARSAAKSLPAGALFLDTRGSKINFAVYEGLRAAKNDDGTPVFEMIVKGGS